MLRSWRWLDYNEQRRSYDDVDRLDDPLAYECPRSRLIGDPDRPPDYAASARIVPNAKTAVHYIGGDQWQIVKTDGVDGSFDADAVSTTALSGNVEMIVEWSPIGVDNLGSRGFFGLNFNDPTLDSGYTAGQTFVVGDPINGFWSFYSYSGNQIGTSPTWEPFARITYDDATGIYSAYTSSNGVTWGAAFASYSGTPGTSHYFDSSLQKMSGASNVTFRNFTPAAAYSLAAAAGVFTYTGQNIGLPVDSKLAAGLGTFTYAGQPAGLGVVASVAANVGTFSYVGQAVNLLRNYTLAAQQGTFSYTGQAVNLTRSIGLSAQVGTFTYSGQSVGLLLGRALAASAGIFSYSGQAINLPVVLNLTADAGVFSYSGQNVNLGFGLALPADAGVFTYNGQPVEMTRSLRITLGAGIFTYNGFDVADTTVNLSLIASAGVFTYSGQPVRYTLSGDTFPVGGSSGPRVVAFAL